MSIPNSDDNAGSLSEEAAEAALMASFEDPAENANDDPNDDDADEGDDGEQEQAANQDDDADDADDGEDSDDDQEEGDDGDEQDQQAPAVTDEAEVEVTVNGETQKVTIGSLKRLAGQEAALTQKSQEADLVGGRAAAALQAAIDAVTEDLTPYADVDWMVLQQQLDPEEFAWHRENAGKAQKRYDKLVNAAQTFEQTVQGRQTNETRRQAQACIAELKADIPEWSDKLYSDILAFGVKEGLDEKDVAAITNPKVVKLLRKAMLFDQGKAVATKKVRNAPTKVLKGTARQDSTRTVNTQKAERRLATSGSDADAVAVLLGRWG